MPAQKTQKRGVEKVGSCHQNKGKNWSLNEMERTGGEPDVIGQDKKTAEYVFCDCSAESR
jgi:hypothetical protein